jgi:hypothetical protein
MEQSKRRAKIFESVIAPEELPGSAAKASQVSVQDAILGFLDTAAETAEWRGGGGRFGVGADRVPRQVAHVDRCALATSMDRCISDATKIFFRQQSRLRLPHVSTWKEPSDGVEDALGVADGNSCMDAGGKATQEAKAEAQRRGIAELCKGAAKQSWAAPSVPSAV